MVPQYHRWLLLLLVSPLLLLWQMGCQPTAPDRAAAKLCNSQPPIDSLRSNIRSDQRLQIVFPPILKTAAEQLAEPLEHLQPILISSNQLKKQQLGRCATLIIGHPRNNAAFESLDKRLPLHWSNKQLQLNGKAYPDSSSVAFLSFYPHPAAPGYPLFVATAYSMPTLRQKLEKRLSGEMAYFGWGGWQYELYQNGIRTLMGKYDPNTWQALPGRQFRLPPDTSAYEQDAIFRYQIREPERAIPAQSIIRACKTQAEEVRKFCGQAMPSSPVAEVAIFPSIERKGLALDDTRPVQVEYQQHAIALVANAYFDETQLGRQNVLLLRKWLGQPAWPALELGLSISFNPHWQNKGYEYWAAWLHKGGNLPLLSELLKDDHLSTASPLVYGAVCASFTRFLIQRWGKDRFLKRYGQWSPSPEALQSLQRAWHAELKTRELSNREPSELPYLKGFNFAHEGYSIFDGYGSKYAEAAIREQWRLGANTIALVPYSYLRRAQQPAPLPLMRRAGTETDESIIRDHCLAQEMGMRTVLKPQVWLGGGQWPGDVDMASEAEWQEFFDHYYRWMRHYALLAEIHQFDLLCVGVEFAKATQERPQDWIGMIQKLRQIYQGPITYAANWGEEFENLSFWESLDYIGLNCYYPLSQKEQPTQEELGRAFARKLQMAERISQEYNRPLLFMEIGFTSTKTPWRSPHEDGHGKTYQAAGQVKAYAAVFRQLSAADDWCQGVLWWKYPSDLSEGGKGHSGFTPNDKPAEQQLPRWFQQLPGS